MIPSLPQLSISIVFAVSLSSCKFFASDPVESTIDSYAALKQLIPDPQKRNKFKEISWDVWNTISPHGCRTCHGGSGSTGWENAKLPNFAYFSSAIFKYLGRNDSLVGLRSLDLTKIAAIMPPPSVAGHPADFEFLDSLNASSNLATNSVQQALGDRILYVNPEGVCLDLKNTGIDPFGASICRVLEALQKFADQWPQEEWNRLVNQARGTEMEHYDPAEGIWASPILEGLSGGDSGDITSEQIDNRVSGNANIVYRRPGFTVAYFVKPAPDDSFVAYTLQKRSSRRYLPRAVSLDSPQKEYFFEGMRYDPIFSPDYNQSKKTGFIMGGKSAGGGSANKVYSFYKPIDESSSEQAISPNFSKRLQGIWGYGTIAKIGSPSLVSSAWASLAGEYVIMGKTGKWLAMKPVLTAAGEIRQFRLFGGAGTRVKNGAVVNPVCSMLSFGSDAMISPNGEWISAKNPSNKTSYIIDTKTCSKFSPSINGHPLKAGKISFSNDGRYATFHAWGADGGTFRLVPFMKDDEIMKLANSGAVANIFTIDLRSESKTVRQQTFYRPDRQSNNQIQDHGSFVSVFPTFNGDSSRLYFDRHKKGASGSEIVYINQPIASW